MKTPRILDPWAQTSPPPYIGHILRADDLGLTPEQRKQLVVQWSADERAAIFWYDDRVRAVVVHQPHGVETGRGLAINDKVDQLYRLYDESPTETRLVELPADEAKSGHGHMEVRRFDQLGVAFMIQKDRVIAIALYPAKTNP